MQHNNKIIKFDIADAELDYYPNFIKDKEATAYFNLLESQTKWQQDEIKIFGNTYMQPRLTALYANNSNSYHYANITMQPHAFTPLMHELKVKIEKVTKTTFSSCLLNLYRNGQDSNGWHADNEKELGDKPIIASLSLGAARYFHFKHRTKKGSKHKLLLEHGSLLVMGGEMQKYWLHQIPKTKKNINPRINLTFRNIV